MGKLFGTDGVRGIANQELTGEIAYKVGRAGGHYLASINDNGRKPVMLIGRDTRLSCDMLEAALTAGIASAGIDVIKLGIIPTPGVSYLANKLDVQGGVMISASHNPIADNGIKFFDAEGFKLSDEMENEIEDLIFNNYDVISSPTHEKIGFVEEKEELAESYIDFLVNTVPVSFEGLKIVLDCANGAAYHAAPSVLRRLGAELVVINDCPDGNKINLNCGSTNPEVVQGMVKKEKADLGISHDGDADRIIMTDENGKLVDGDQIMAVLALDLLKRNKLAGKTLVTTNYSNLGLKESIESHGGNLAVTANGDRYVVEEMRANGYNLGGEQSGHIVCLDYNHTGDGVLTAVQVIRVVKENGSSLSELVKVLDRWPQLLSNVRVKRKDEWEENPEIIFAIKKAEEKLDDKGRIFVRASGTEPVVRVMIEGKDASLIEELEKEVVEVIKNKLN